MSPLEKFWGEGGLADQIYALINEAEPAGPILTQLARDLAVGAA